MHFQKQFSLGNEVLSGKKSSWTLREKRFALIILTYNGVVTLHGQSIVLHSTRADDVELAVTRCGGEVSHIF